MITLFNRRELLTTFSLKEQAEVKDALAAKGIRFRTRTVSHNSIGNREGRSGMGTAMDYACEYTVYVHRNDYGEAMNAMCGKNNGR